MTEVSFHFNVPDRLHYACRLLRKATRMGGRVAVVARAAWLAELDRTLWSFDPLEFVPHARLGRGAKPADRMAATPIWLVESALDAPHHDVLLNFLEEVPDEADKFERVIELVSGDDEERARARVRWKAYAARGFRIQSHEVGAEG